MYKTFLSYNVSSVILMQNSNKPHSQTLYKQFISSFQFTKMTCGSQNRYRYNMLQCDVQFQKSIICLRNHLGWAKTCVIKPLILDPFEVNLIKMEPVFKDHLSYQTAILLSFFFSLNGIHSCISWVYLDSDKLLELK